MTVEFRTKRLSTRLQRCCSIHTSLRAIHEFQAELGLVGGRYSRLVTRWLLSAPRADAAKRGRAISFLTFANVWLADFFVAVTFDFLRE